MVYNNNNNAIKNYDEVVTLQMAAIIHAERDHWSTGRCCCRAFLGL